MNIIILCTSVLFFFLLFFLNSSERGPYTRFRESILLTLIAHAALIFALNETLSFFDKIEPVPASVFWALVVVILLVVLVRKYHNNKKQYAAKLSELKGVFRLENLTISNRVVVILSLLIFLLPLLFLAVYAAPNNFDSHNYHLHRILSWTQNHNLDHFPTLHIHQLYLNVFAEYMVLNTVLLSGSDWFAGSIQFGAFIGAIAGVSLLAKRMDLGQGGQLLAAVFFLTLPIGILESTSTQVDLCACFFLITYVYFGFELLRRRGTVTLVALVLSLALGGFTKYTVFIFAIPFTVYFAVNLMKQYGILYSFKIFCIAVLALGITFSPFFYRNFTFFGHIMHPLSGGVFGYEELPSTKYSLSFTLSGVLKNAGLQIGLPETRFNVFVEKQIRDLHDMIGVGIDDPDLSRDTFSLRYSVHEDMIPNPLHFWLIVAASLSLLFVRRYWNVKWISICAVIGFVLFCTLMKFQLWSTRTQMPFFAMGAVILAFVYNRVLQFRTAYLSAVLMLLSVSFVYSNPSKELIPINFLARKLLGHIPVAICENGPDQRRLFQKTLGMYYDFSGTGTCHPLKRALSYRERKALFRLLDQAGYYDLDKASNILKMGRDQAYFLSHPENYNNFKPLLDHIRGNDKNVGILFREGNGFYHYWAAIATKVEKPGKMDYIRFSKEFMVLPNAQKDFCYNYILSDDMTLVDSFVPIANIDTIYSTPLFNLVVLKQPSCERSLF
jgi:hypothetical protein